MTIYSTCINCAADRKSCQRRATISRAIKGCSITSIKFRCVDRIPMFAPGQRVSVTWPTTDDQGFVDTETWPATIIVESGSRFVIQVDDVPGDLETPAREYVNNPNLFAKVTVSKLRALDEPARIICDFCGGAPGDGPCPERGKGWDDNPPSCLLSRRAA